MPLKTRFFLSTWGTVRWLALLAATHSAEPPALDTAPKKLTWIVIVSSPPSLTSPIRLQRRTDGTIPSAHLRLAAWGARNSLTNYHALAAAAAAVSCVLTRAQTSHKDCRNGPRDLHTHTLDTRFPTPAGNTKNMSRLCTAIMGDIVPPSPA